MEILTAAAPEAQFSDNVFDCSEEDAASSQEEIQSWVAELGLTTGGADKVLSAEQGKALKALIDALDAAKHSHANKDVLDAISKAGSGNLVFNGKELTGETGIAFGDSIENATAYTGKLRVVVEDYTVPGV